MRQHLWLTQSLRRRQRLWLTQRLLLRLRLWLWRLRSWLWLMWLLRPRLRHLRQGIDEEVRRQGKL